MRIVHEIDGEPQVGGGGNAYVNMRGYAGYNGARGDVIITSKDGDAIYIEGEIDVLIEAFGAALEAMKLSRDAMREKMGPKRESACPNCDRRQLADTNTTHTEECDQKYAL